MSDDEEEYVYSDDDDNFVGGDGDEDLGPSDAAVGGAGAGTSAAAVGGAGGATVPRASGHSYVKSSLTASSSSSADYRLLSPDEIDKERTRLVQELASVLDMPAECANTLLLHFKWNRERALDSYTADPKAVAEAAGIAHLGVSAKPTAAFDCMMCLTPDVPPSEGFALGCKHFFCRSCWAGFLASAVATGGEACVLTRCPASADGCTEAVTQSVVASMAAPEVAARWRRFEQQQFVNVSKNMAWCPRPGCSAAFVARVPVRTAVCTCGCKFCFKCSREAHEPLGCPGLDRWLEKCGSESETANWILAHTKKCPLCGVRIEKNQGCNHIKCNNKGCRHEFCWVCLGPWTEHGQSTGGFYKCNKFTGSVPKPGDGASDAARAKAELERYLFYFQRYTNHDQAGKFAAKHREAASRRMAELQAAGGLDYADVTFLNDATEALLECRRTLKYTYAFGYYMKDGGEKSLFEHLQEQLERSTEHLAELTEKPVDKMDRGEVINFTRVTMQFLRNLITGVEDGLTGE